MDISHPIAALKQKISQQFNLMPKCFKVFVKNQEISSDDDEKTLTDLKYPQTIVIQNQPALIADYEASHPRQFLTENQEYFNLLLNLLSREGGSGNAPTHAFRPHPPVVCAQARALLTRSHSLAELGGGRSELDNGVQSTLA